MLSTAISGSHIGYCKSMIYCDDFKILGMTVIKEEKNEILDIIYYIIFSEKNFIEIILAIQKLKPPSWVFSF